MPTLFPSSIAQYPPVTDTPATSGGPGQNGSDGMPGGDVGEIYVRIEQPVGFGFTKITFLATVAREVPGETAAREAQADRLAVPIS